MREDAVRAILDAQTSAATICMTRGRRTSTAEANQRGERIRHLYFQLGKTEQEIASELGIKCSTVNYYKNRQKR